METEQMLLDGIWFQGLCYRVWIVLMSLFCVLNFLVLYYGFIHVSIDFACKVFTSYPHLNQRNCPHLLVHRWWEVMAVMCRSAQAWSWMQRGSALEVLLDMMNEVDQVRRLFPSETQLVKHDFCNGGFNTAACVV